MMNKKKSSGSKRSYAAEITQFIMKHRVMIFGYIMTQTSDYTAAEDIFQEVCLTVCQKFSEFEKGSNFKAWAMAIARIKILNYYQGTEKERKIVRLAEDLSRTLGESDVWTEKEGTYREELYALRKCLNKIKGKSRKIILQRYGRGLSCRKVAEYLGWSLDAVYVALSRIRSSLERCIKKTVNTERID